MKIEISNEPQPTAVKHLKPGQAFVNPCSVGTGYGIVLEGGVLYKYTTGAVELLTRGSIYETEVKPVDGELVLLIEGDSTKDYGVA